MSNKIKSVRVLTTEPKKLICDDEDEEFTGYCYYSCPTCEKSFGHADNVPINKICPRCGQKLRF